MIIISLLLKLQSTSKTAKVSGAFIICIGEFYCNISNVNGVSQLFVNMQQETVVQPLLSHSRSQICKETPKSIETSLRCA